jgi:hypothetical protein
LPPPGMPRLPNTNLALLVGQGLPISGAMSESSGPGDRQGKGFHLLKHSILSSSAICLNGLIHRAVCRWSLPNSSCCPCRHASWFGRQTMTNLLYYALQARHTVLRQKKLARFSNSNLYSDKRRPFLKVHVKLGHPGSSCLRPACHACHTVNLCRQELRHDGTRREFITAIPG